MIDYKAAAAALLFAAPVPAFATQPEAPPADRERPAAQSAQRDARDQRICVRDSLTGSRLVRSICKTRTEWEAEGGVPGEE